MADAFRSGSGADTLLAFNASSSRSADRNPRSKDSLSAASRKAGAVACNAWKDIPRDIGAGINTQINRILATEEMQIKLAAQGFEPHGGTPAGLADYVNPVVERYSQIVREAGEKWIRDALNRGPSPLVYPQFPIIGRMRYIPNIKYIKDASFDTGRLLSIIHRPGCGATTASVFGCRKRQGALP